jgi:hypothetical protein
MGYTTEFSGSFKLDKPLTEAQVAYLNEFSATRRMKRDVAKMQGYKDPIREAVGLPLGREGEFYVGAGDNNRENQPLSNEPPGDRCFGQHESEDIVNYNSPPDTQPGLWCQWEPTKDGTGIIWNGGEKFYYYIPWLQYLIANFLAPWGYVLNGEVEWQGENDDDSGVIVVKNNIVI